MKVESEAKTPLLAPAGFKSPVMDRDMDAFFTVVDVEEAVGINWEDALSVNLEASGFGWLMDWYSDLSLSSFFCLALMCSKCQKGLIHIQTELQERKIDQNAQNSKKTWRKEK
jgi:hypothetical protein